MTPFGRNTSARRAVLASVAEIFFMRKARCRIGAVSLFAVAAVPASLLGALFPTPTPTPTPAPLKVQLPDFVAGKPFPPVTPSAVKLPAERRTYFVSPGPAPGDGSEARPWNDLQTALRALAPGDRLRVRAGTYTGPVQIDRSCKDGTAKEPIQVVFDGKATLQPAAEGAIVTIARAHWWIVGCFLKLEDTEASGISLAGPDAHDVTLEGLRVLGGRGPSVRIGKDAARISLLRCNMAKSPLKKATPSAFGVEIAAGAEDVVVSQSRLHENPAGSIRVQAPTSEGKPARYLRIVGNSIYDDGATAIRVDAGDDVAITDNVFSDRTIETGTRAIVLTRVRRGDVRSNRISDFALGIHVGHADPDGRGTVAAEDVTIARNHLETSRTGGTAVVIEAAHRAVVANNLVSGYASGILVFGKLPGTRDVTVANNLLLGLSDVAFLLADPASAALFDYNVFSPAGPVLAEFGGASVPLAGFLKEGKMPHSELKPGVHILQGDLARVMGLATVDRGTPVKGVPFKGAAPDIGVAER